MTTELNVVTGAFGYTGAYIARDLIADGARVRTLTNHARVDDPLAANSKSRRSTSIAPTTSRAASTVSMSSSTLTGFVSRITASISIAR
jgi:nucleoside-diphosphate-sugar epimerase